MHPSTAVVIFISVFLPNALGCVCYLRPFFRADALAQVGGWDAHNVAEDADLGMRLARAGKRCALIDSTTFEEATCRVWPWIRQRSRWVKGYMQTWRAHMRRPRHAYRGLGTRGFLGLQVLLLGSVASYLAQPIFWGAIGYRLWSGEPLWSDAAPNVVGWGFIALLAIGQAAIFATALIAVWRRGLSWLAPWCLTLPLYWPLGACAAYKALWEMFVAPFYWDKTDHAVSRHASQKGPGRRVRLIKGVRSTATAMRAP